MADSVPAPMVQVPADKWEAFCRVVNEHRQIKDGHPRSILHAARTLVDAATPAASVPAADIPRVARSLSDLKPGQVVALTRRSIDRRRIGTIRSVGKGGAMLQLEGDDLRSQSAFSFDVGEWVILEDTTPAAEQADKGEAADTPRDEEAIKCPTCGVARGWNEDGRLTRGIWTLNCVRCGSFQVEIEDAPAAPPETVCRCGHPKHDHFRSTTGCGVRVPLCQCTAFNARVPVNDEAEAEEAAWQEWNRWGESVTQTPMIREAHRAGFRAARGENA